MIAFLYKHFQLSTKIEKALGEVLIMESDPEPYDVESLSLKERAVMEVLTEQTENANAGHDDAVDDITINVTSEMVEAKIEELKKSQSQ